MHYLTNNCGQLLVLNIFIIIFILGTQVGGFESDTYELSNCSRSTGSRKFGVRYELGSVSERCKLISSYEGLAVEFWIQKCTSYCYTNYMTFLPADYNRYVVNVYRYSQKLKVKLYNGTEFGLDSDAALQELVMLVHDPSSYASSDADYISIGYGAAIISTTSTSGYEPNTHYGMPKGTVIIIGAVSFLSIVIIVIVAVKGYKIYAENCGGDIFTDDYIQNETPARASAPPEYSLLILSSTAGSADTNAPPGKDYTTNLAPPPDYDQACALGV